MLIFLHQKTVDHKSNVHVECARIYMTACEILHEQNPTKFCDMNKL